MKMTDEIHMPLTTYLGNFPIMKVHYTSVVLDVKNKSCDYCKDNISLPMTFLILQDWYSLLLM